MISKFASQPMDLMAASLGYAVPCKDFAARVHSVFRTSVNFQAEGVDGLLTLTSRSHIDLPQGIRLDPDEEVYFDNLRPGQNVFFQNGVISFQGMDLRIDIRHAFHWKCNLPALEVNLNNTGSAHTWSHVWETINSKQKSAGTEIVLQDLACKNTVRMTAAARKAREAVRKLVLTTRQFNPEVISSARELIGLGSGLTPSGDDLLAGYITGLWCTVAGKNDRHGFTSMLGNAIIDHSTATNDISRTYLLHAAKGQAASYLVNLAKIISKGEDSKALAQTIELVFQVGHSSGMDAVTGLLIGLSVWTLADNSEPVVPPAQLIL